MDPLSLAASIAGLVQISGVVISYCYDYGCAVSSALTEQRQLLTEITTLSGLLIGLQSRVNAGSLDTSDNTYGIAEVVGDTVMQCRIILREVADRLDSVSTVTDVGECVGERGGMGMRRRFRRGFKRVFWPFKQKETMDLIERLERQKATLTTALSADTISVVQETRVDIKGIQDKLETARVEQENEKRMEHKRGNLNWLSEVDYKKMHQKASS